ncbi:Lipin/Ned1/Smp2-domain-containing protein [Syncephalastrum racemosum]|uniref:phosphatidate phosphatase n=1 Tax=Syncephalastrum racemosum TaxID=13706 RepID=A0A1X2HLW6_SYNRA|nr:Lipin/Ned1/Smp2-domain-containing protein [Syncephalastrum racemosum]
MEYVGRLGNFFTSVQNFYSEINPATLSGAIDIVVVKQQDGELACSPFHVRFGKLSLLMPSEKKVEIKVNGELIPYMMKVGEAGESFFVFETEHEVPEEFQTSPIVQAMMENKSDEEPPYLDIGESKEQDAKSPPQLSDLDSVDGFEDEETNKAADRMRLPAELQSPKMIIEEQVDKVVTKMDPYHKHPDLEHAAVAAKGKTEETQKLVDSLSKAADHLSLGDDQDPELSPTNDVYPMDDGATLLERFIPEAITSTTIAKETFIVRPADGDIFSKWMDVIHTAVDTRDEHGTKETNDTHHRHGDTESIVLDIAGYKTEEEKPRSREEQSEQHDSDRQISTGASIAEDALADATSVHANQESQPESAVKGPTTEDRLPESVKKKVTDDIKVTENELEAPVTTTGTESEKEAKHKEDEQDVQPSHDEKIKPPPIDTSVTEPGNQLGDDITLKPGETYRIEMSLCGLSTLGSDEEKNKEIFNEQQITYDNFVHNPNLLNDRRLVFRHGNRYYATGSTGPLFTSLLLFKRPLDDTDGSPKVGDTAPKVSDSRDTYSFGRGWRQWLSRSSVAGSPMPPSTEQIGEPPIQEKEDTDENADHDTSTNSSNNNNTSSNERTTFTTTTKTTSVGWSAEHSHPGEELPPGLRKNYAKTLRLTSEQLKNLNLKKGVNSISFSVTSEYQGTATCAAKIFYWDYDVHIVISDIDGTITKSDALGHVFTMFGKDWTHNGVAKLYTDVQRNGYQLLYLTSRAIGQADYTRDYLKKVEQDKFQLPDGPVIMSPDRLFTSLHREVIMRKPEVFKMACLRDVLRLFGGRNPFYAGFGNRITDAISYRSVNVPASRIFTIDPNGEIKLELLQGFKSSYIHLNDLVDQIFPPINKAIDEEYNDFNFWKAPLPEIDLPELPAEPTPTSPKPKPIVPDPSTLPAQSVASAPEKRRQRGILRSFTSRSSSTASSSASSTSPYHRSPPLSSTPVKVAASASTPALLTSHATDPNTRAEDISDDRAPSPTVLHTNEGSSSIMNKVLGGVFSRSFSTKQQQQQQQQQQQDGKLSPSQHASDADPNKALVGSPEAYEEADEENFDATLDAITDEIDMDNIPFI